jgi:hypothetical protein
MDRERRLTCFAKFDTPELQQPTNVAYSASAEVQKTTIGIRNRINAIKDRFEQGTAGRVLQDLYAKVRQPGRSDAFERRSDITNAMILNDIWALTDPRVFSLCLSNPKLVADYIEVAMREACLTQKFRDKALTLPEFRDRSENHEPNRNVPFNYDHSTVLTIATYLNSLL